MNNMDLRCRVFGMDARRKVRRMVVPFASFATPQTPECTATLRAGVALGASPRCKPLVVNDTTARLAPWSASQSDPGASPCYSFTSP